MAKILTLKELTKKEVLLASGHRMCAGCGAPTVVKMVLLAIDYPVVAANATGCLEVSSCISDYTAWKIPWIHNAFENAAATISGVETMYRWECLKTICVMLLKTCTNFSNAKSIKTLSGMGWSSYV